MRPLETRTTFGDSHEPYQRFRHFAGAECTGGRLGKSGRCCRRGDDGRCCASGRRVRTRSESRRGAQRPYSHGSWLMAARWSPAGVTESRCSRRPCCSTPASRGLTPTGSLQTPRLRHTATLLRDGRVLIAGGQALIGSGTPPVPLESAEIYDPVSGRFTQTGSMHAPRVMHAAVLLATGKVLICGGVGRVTSSGAADGLAAAELYDPKTGQFTAAGTMTVQRFDDSATLFETGRVLVTADGTRRGLRSVHESVCPDGQSCRAAPRPQRNTAR